MPRKPRQERGQVLEKAMHLFWRHGYSGCSLRDLETGLDMRPGSIYAMFGSKEGLFQEALAFYARRNRQTLNGYLNQYESPLAALRAYMAGLAEESARARDSEASAPSCLLVKTLLETGDRPGPVRDQVNALLGEIQAALVAVLERAKREGELAPETDCDRLGQLFQAQIMGLRSIAERDLPASQIRQLAMDMVDRLLPEPA